MTLLTLNMLAANPWDQHQMPTHVNAANQWDRLTSAPTHIDPKMSHLKCANKRAQNNNDTIGGATFIAESPNWTDVILQHPQTCYESKSMASVDQWE